jgi:thioredoxin-dependent peroxiredoxin
VCAINLELRQLPNERAVPYGRLDGLTAKDFEDQGIVLQSVEDPEMGPISVALVEVPQLHTKALLERYEWGQDDYTLSFFSPRPNPQAVETWLISAFRWTGGKARGAEPGPPSERMTNTTAKRMIPTNAAPLLGEEAPNFTAYSTEGTIGFHEWLGTGWGVLFSHPKDFTPVGTTELGTMAKLKDEFAKRNTKVIAVSVDPLDSHERWISDIEDTQGTTVTFPIISDPDRKVADLYGMIHPNASDTMTVRSVFVIGPDKKVKLTITYPATTGRNFNEILRVIDSLQLTAGYSVATPANWVNGEDVIIVPAVSDEVAKEKFPKGWDAKRPYLRITPQPNL